MIIGSIDVGIVNMGFCLLDSATNRVKHVEIINLLFVPGNARRLNYGDKSAVFLVKRAITARQHLFDQCDVIGIEKQMSRKMIIIQIALESVLAGHCTVFQISPRSVKTVFNTSRGNHTKNKHAAIRRMYDLLDADGREKFNGFRKKDDVADAILQAMYIAKKYDFLMDQKIKACSIPTKKRKRRRRG